MLEGLAGSLRPAIAIATRNSLASCVLVALACAIHLALPFYDEQTRRTYEFFGLQFSGATFLIVFAFLYASLVVLYYFWLGDGRDSKALLAIRCAFGFFRRPVVTWRQGLQRPERVAVLVVVLKGFFGPLMLLSLLSFLTDALSGARTAFRDDFSLLSAREVFDRYGFWIALQLLFFIDVLVFTVGYLVEDRRLDNEIRSVDPTLLGWAAALICYPPINLLTVTVLGSQFTTFPQFENSATHFLLNILILVLIAIYVWASVALGFKASNLTHRGIIRKGPYRYVRHPAYAAKNVAWWVGSIPLVLASFSESFINGLMGLGAVAGWTGIYLLRALTEEDHLKSVDGEYREYASAVRYRFVPGMV